MRILALLCGLAVVSVSAKADIIYAATSGNSFGTYDTIANTFNNLGSSSALIYGMGFNGGVLYANDSSSTPSLYAVNTSDGVLSLVGALGNGNYATMASAAGGGTLYAIDENNNLDTINPSTGAASTVGPLGFSVGGQWDANFGPDGNFYASSFGNLYRIDLSTGAGTLVGSFGGGVRLQSIVAADGYLDGFDLADMYQVNLVTGAATSIQVAPAVFEAETQFPSSVPEPGSLLLCAAGMAFVFRRVTLG